MSVNAIAPVGKGTADEGTNETVSKQSLASGSVWLVLASCVKEMLVKLWLFNWEDCHVLKAFRSAVVTLTPPAVSTFEPTLGLICQWIGVSCHLAGVGAPFTSSCSGL